MKKVLIYTSFSSRSRDTESVMEGLVQKGHEVFLLTQEAEGEYHRVMRELGVKCYSHKIEKKSSLRYFWSHARYLLKFIREHKINVVFAHLENAGLPAVLIQSFCKAKIVVCRHIVDEAYLFKSKNFILQNKIVYKLAKYIIVVSNRSKQFMIEKEHISASKIDVINLGYNFNLYSKVDSEKSLSIKTQFKSSLLMISICRLVESKRPQLSIQLAEKLIQHNSDVKLIILGEGPDKSILQKHIESKNLTKNVFLLGHVSNALDYLSAANILIHPSILDSSSVTVKEAGLLKKPIIACKDVGDLDEYIVNYESGLLLDKNKFVEEAETFLLDLLAQKVETNHWGENLHKIVYQRFSIDSILVHYNKYLN